MTHARPAEASHIHTRLLKCALQVDESRAYWHHTDGTAPANPVTAFESYWFGARSLPWINILLSNLRARFDAFPPSLAVLHAWRHMPPDTRRLICHWHLQLSDPLYRNFTGTFLVARRNANQPTISRDRVVAFVAEQGPGRWTIPTRIQFASKLLSAAHTAGLVAGTRDPRALPLPRVPNEALAYLLHLLRGLDFAGTLLANPYTASVGLDGPFLEDRLRAIPGLTFARQGDLIDFGWHHPNLTAWAAATVADLASTTATPTAQASP